MKMENKCMNQDLPIKVIHITENLGWGGVNSFVYDLCRELKKQGLDVEIVGIIEHPDGECEINQELRREGIHIINYKAKGKISALLKVWKLHTYLRSISRQHYVICNLHLKVGVLIGVISSMFVKNVRCVETYHNMYSHYWIQLKCCSPFIRKYICVSETARGEMKKRFGIKDNRLVTIENGVDCKGIKYKYMKTYLEKSDKSPVNVISVGRLSKEKGFIYPVTAFYDMCSDKCRYTIVGDGPEKNDLETAKRDNQYIRLMGRMKRQDVFRALASSDLLVMSSEWEGRSILLMESMALGLPMILSDIDSFCELLSEEHLSDSQLFKKCRWGYLVKQDSIDGYKMALGDFLNNNNVREMKEYILKLSEMNDIEQTAKRYVQVYTDVGKK